MKTFDHISRILIRAFTAFLVSAATTAPASPPPKAKVIESQRRLDLSAGGSAQRIGMLRQQHRTQRLIEQQTKTASPDKK